MSISLFHAIRALATQQLWTRLISLCAYFVLILFQKCQDQKENKGFFGNLCKNMVRIVNLRHTPRQFPHPQTKKWPTFLSAIQHA
jgi:hypothetical protein